MPLHPERAAPLPADAGELAPGQFVFEVLGDLVRELDAEALMSLVGAIQRGDPWQRLSPSTRDICVDLDARLFDGE
jgi:hypothetical protein